MQLVASIGEDGQPITSQNAIPMCFDSALLSFGLVDESERRHLYELIREGSENLLKAVIDYEAGLTADERGCTAAQTDVLGLCFYTDSDTCAGIELSALGCLHYAARCT